MPVVLSSDNGSPQISVWSVDVAYAFTFATFALGSLFQKVICVGVPRAATTTGPR
jgi:hypothetical protein